MSVQKHPVAVVGSGPAGLSCAAEMRSRGIPTQVLERRSQLAGAWRDRYDALRFNTSRIHSALPGAPFPRNFGQFPTRDQYVAYLHQYAQRRRIPVETGVHVTRLTPTEGGTWAVTTASGNLEASGVLVATGIFNAPYVPDWPGKDKFDGDLLHAVDYRRAQPYRGADVLVVGAGSTGMEIAHDLAIGGASRVRLAARSGPNILYRTVGGLPADLPLPVFMRLPTRWVDAWLQVMQRRVVGDLSQYGLESPREGPISQLKRRGAGTAIVDPPVIDAVRNGAIEVVRAVRQILPHGALLDDGSDVKVDTIIAATGYSTGLREMVGHLNVLDHREMPIGRDGEEVIPGLRFVGYDYRPGLTRQVGRTARQVAREVSRNGVAHTCTNRTDSRLDQFDATQRPRQ
jgi:cation diffusion facilitator CzcD-associated flavoprotein CzcO